MIEFHEASQDDTVLYPVALSLGLDDNCNVLLVAPDLRGEDLAEVRRLVVSLGNVESVRALVRVLGAVLDAVSAPDDASSLTDGGAL